MTTTFIQKIIYVEPKYVDKNIKSYISEKIKTDFMGKCFAKEGLILKIYDKLQILDNTISTAGNFIIFNVSFKAKMFKPEKGEDYTGTVCMIFQNGIFAEILNRIKVFIPLDKLKKYQYDKNLNVFKNGDKIIKKGDDIKFTIQLIKYEKQNFNCIASLKT